jgi:hypothetical protein
VLWEGFGDRLVVEEEGERISWKVGSRRDEERAGSEIAWGRKVGRSR